MAERIFVDQLGRELHIPIIPKRILSTVPSLTEAVADLFGSDCLVGRTKFCIHPKEIYSKPKVGGTKNLDLEFIDRLKPDFILSNKEENDKNEIETLSEKYPVYISDIKTISDTVDCLKDLGKILNNSSEVVNFLHSNRWKNIKHFDHEKVLYLIWKGPYMTIGGDTFISHILESIGLNNVCAALARYPELTREDIVQLNPRFVFLSSEPFPFREKHIAELSRILPQAKIVLVDGEMFSWYGTRIFRAQKYFNSLRQHLSY